MAVKLKPCPLCGRDAGLTKLEGRTKATWNVHCGNEKNEDPADSYGCGLVLFGDYGVPRSTMIDRWNRRSES